MKEECLICKAPLEYLETDELMECAICHKNENSKTHCVNGHYVCNDCHTRGMDTIIGLCLAETSKNPIEIINKMMDLPFCHMHGPKQMKVFIVYCHPSEDSFTRNVCDAFIKGIVDSGNVKGT